MSTSYEELVDKIVSSPLINQMKLPQVLATYSNSHFRFPWIWPFMNHLSSFFKQLRIFYSKINLPLSNFHVILLIFLQVYLTISMVTQIHGPVDTVIKENLQVVSQENIHMFFSKNLRSIFS